MGRVQSGFVSTPRRHYVYVIGHDEGPQKIGYSGDPACRAWTLKKAGEPHYQVHHQVEVLSEDVRAVEALAHHLASAKALGRERFDISVAEATSIVDEAVRRYALGERAPERTDLMSERINLVCTNSFVEMVNDWRRTQRPIPSWGKAVRDLVDGALEARERTKPKPD